jgi:hypothetical protein
MFLNSIHLFINRIVWLQPTWLYTILPKVWVFWNLFKCLSPFLIIFSLSGINIGAENKKNTETRAACKILTREHHGRVHLSWASKWNVWLFSWIFTYYAFAILALICNWICMGSHQHCIKNTQPDQKLLWVLQLWLDSFLCWAYLIQLRPKKLFCQPDADLTSCFRYLEKHCWCFKKSRHCSAYAVNQS